MSDQVCELPFQNPFTYNTR